MTLTKSYLGSATRVSIVLVYGAMAFLIANHLGQTDPDRPGSLFLCLALPVSADEDSGCFGAILVMRSTEDREGDHF